MPALIPLSHPSPSKANINRASLPLPSPSSPPLSSQDNNKYTRTLPKATPFPSSPKNLSYLLLPKPHLTPIPLRPRLPPPNFPAVPTNKLSMASKYDLFSSPIIAVFLPSGRPYTNTATKPPPPPGGGFRITTMSKMSSRRTGPWRRFLPLRYFLKRSE